MRRWLNRTLFRLTSRSEGRRGAARRLAKLGDYEFLLKSLTGPAAEERRAAAQAFTSAPGTLQNPVHSKLIWALSTSPECYGEITLVLDAADAEWRESETALQVAGTLTRELKAHPDNEVLVSALKTFGTAAEASMLQAVSWMTWDNYDRDFFLQAARILGEMKSRQAIAPLIKKLGDNEIREELLEILENLEPEWREIDSGEKGGLTDLVIEGDLDVLQEIEFDWKSVAAREALQPLIRRLVSKDMLNRSSVMSRLDLIGPDWTSHPEIEVIVPDLVDMLNTYSPMSNSDSRDAREVLLRLRLPNAVPLILEKIESPPLPEAFDILDAWDPQWSETASAEKALERCTELWRRDLHRFSRPMQLTEEARLNCVMAIMRISPPHSTLAQEIRGHYLTKLRSKKNELRLSAAGTLAHIPAAENKEPLLKALEDPDEWVREKACDALFNLGDPETADAFLTALEDSNRFVRQTAAKALGELGDEGALTPLLGQASYGEAAEASVRALEKLVERCARRLTSEQLRSILDLRSQQESYFDTESLAHPYGERTVEGVDCSHLHELARNELRRRRQDRGSD